VNIRSGTDQLTIDKQILALDALSKLAKQFSNKPDFDQLNELLILTVSGQFAVPNAFAMIRQPGSQSPIPLFFAAGKYRNDRLLLSQELSADHCKYFLENRAPAHVADLTKDSKTAKLALVLSECNTRIVAPLLHNDSLIGILGLGDKVTEKPFGESDMELLSTLVNAITPFLASSFLFSEISGLNAWYVDILNSVEQGIFIFDNNNLLKQVNKTGFEILKQFRPNLIHIETVHMLPIDVVFPDSIYGNWAKRFVKSRNNPKSGLLENMMAASGENERLYNVHISRISGNSVLETDLIITLDDVTGQKESEHRLFELQKFADKGVMASSISHELNNFLGLVLGGVEITQISLGKGDMEKVSANLERLKASISKMERFTNGLMDYTKLQTQKRISSLNDVISDVLSYVAAQKRFKRTRVLSDLDPKLPEFEMDADQMSQLLLNLLNNAADAINETNATTGEIVVRTMLHSNSAILVVSDNGAGVKPEVKQKLFRAHMTTKEHGHGYGLVTCSKIIDNHSGEVTIDSELGTGTTFTFNFPLS
jgi:signal transduction histidine kinase